MLRFDSGSGIATDERTRSAMLAGTHATYELKENIIVCERACQELEVRFKGARMSVGRTLGSQGMPTRRSTRRVRGACRLSRT